MDRSGTSVQSKAKTLTPFCLRSNREGIATLCQQAAVSTLPDPQPLGVADRRLTAAELISTSPEIARRTLDQRLTSGQAVLSKTTTAEVNAGSSALLDARSRLQVSDGTSPRGPRTLSAGAPAFDAGSEYGSCASLDSVDLRLSTRSAAGRDADISSAVDSDAAAAAGELRRRRRAELVRARTAGERSALAGSGASEQPGTTVIQPAASTTDSAALRRFGISTSSSSTPALHLPESSSSAIDGEFPVAAPRATERSTISQNFQPTHSKTPWRSVRSASDTAHDDVPFRLSDHRSHHAVTNDHRQQLSQTTSVPSSLTQSPSSAASSSRSPCVTSADVVKYDHKSEETRLIASASSLAASCPSKTETVAVGSDVVASVAAETRRAKPRITIYSSDTRDLDTVQGSSGVGHDAVQTKDRFNELLGKAIESTTVSAGGQHQQFHHEHSTVSQLNYKPSAVVNQYVHEKATSSTRTKDETESKLSTPSVSDSSFLDSLSRGFSKESTALCCNSAVAVATTQSVALDSANTAVSKVPHQTSQQQSSKQYTPDSTVSIATESTADNTEFAYPAVDKEQRTKSDDENVEISSESAGASGKPERNMPSKLPTDLNKELLHDESKRKLHSENRLDKTRRTGSRPRQPNVVEETQIVHVLSFGSSDTKSRSSTLKGAEVALGGETPFPQKSDTATPQFCQKETESHLGELRSKLSGEERSEMSQSFMDTSNNCVPTAPQQYFSDTTEQLLTTDGHLDRSGVPQAVKFKDPSKLSGDSLSLYFKPSTVAPRELHQADTFGVPPWSEQEVERLDEPERQTVVVQEAGMPAEQEMSQDGDTEVERVRPRTIDPVVDDGRFLQSAVCQYHADPLSLAAGERGEYYEKSSTDPSTEKVEYMEDVVHFEQVKPRIVEPQSTDQRRSLTKTGCHSRADVLTLASETGDGRRKCYIDPNAEKIGYIDGFRQFERRVQPGKVESTFVDASPHLSKTRCQYRTKLLTFHPADKNVVVQAGLYRKLAVDKPKESTGKIDGLKSESSTCSTVEDATVHRWKEMVKVLPAPQILTMMPQRRQPVGNMFKSKDEFSPSKLEQGTERKGVPDVAGRNVGGPPKSDVGAFPVSQQQAEIAGSLSHKIRTQDSTQSTTVSTSSDAASSGFPGHRSSDEFTKSDGNVSVALVGQHLDGGQRGLELTHKSLIRQTSGQNADVRWNSRAQSQDNTTVLQPFISDEMQMQQSNPVTTTPPTINTSSIVTAMASGNNRASVSTEFSTSSRKEETISLSNDVVGSTNPAGRRDNAAVEPYRAKFPTNPRPDGADANVAVKRDWTKKARNILRSREDFLALQPPSDVGETTRGDAGTTFAPVEPSSAARRTTDPAEKDVVDSQSRSRPERTVKIALSEDDVNDEQDDDERLRHIAAADTAKAAFPPLVSGRSWHTIVRSSAEEPAASSPGGVDRRAMESRRTAAASRAAFAADRAETTVGVPDTPRVPRPILQSAKSLDAEPSLSGTINNDPQLSADNDERLHQVGPADTARAAFPPLVSGRSWDAIVRGSVEEPATSPGEEDRRPTDPRRTAATSRVAFATARAETTVGVPDTPRVPRPVLQSAKSLDAELSLSGTVNMDPQLAADDDETLRQVAAADTAKAAFPPLVSGRSWDAIVRSSVEEPAGEVDRRITEPRRTVAASRVAYAAARAETAVGVPDAVRTARPILQMAKSLDVEQSLSRTVNMDPQLAAVLRMRKQREEEQEREEAATKAEENRYQLNF